MANKTREPLVHISRRSTLPWYQSWGIRACALILSLGVCALVTMFTTGENPLSVFGAIYDASFSSQRRTWVLFQNIAMLLSVSLAVVPAFKMRFWNLGGEGQMLAGALATTACMICLRDAFPNGALIPVMIVCSIAAGALWGFVPAFFKAKWGTNETLFTLMMH
jgi:simple sugar transport system permease protein